MASKIVRLHVLMNECGHEWIDDCYEYETIRVRTFQNIKANQHIMCRGCGKLGFIDHSAVEILRPK